LTRFKKIYSFDEFYNERKKSTVQTRVVINWDCDSGSMKYYLKIDYMNKYISKYIIYTGCKNYQIKH